MKNLTENKQITVIETDVTFCSNGYVLINDEVYGTEQEYYNDIESGKIYIADSKRENGMTSYFDKNGNRIGVR